MQRHVSTQRDSPMQPPDELVAHLARSTRLSMSEAARLVLEVMAYFAEPLERFVQRRHAELRRDGLRNAAIYARLAAEVSQRRFLAAPLSERQIRRLIYG
jgi:hypothetical protein